MKYRIAPSILSADWLNLGKDIERVNEADCDWIHFDVMDGKFVPETSFGETCLKAVKKITEKPLDVHLMIEDPIRNIRTFAKNGANRITVHLEACEDVRETLALIHSCGLPAGLSVKPGTPIEDVFPYLEDVEMILVMSVEPGFGGQAFIPESLDRIRELRAKIEERGLDVDIQVDGGINLETVKLVRDAGANVFVSGSALFKGDLIENTAKMRALL